MLCFTWITAQESAETETEVQVIDLIKQHGLEKSEVMEIASWITDVHGPRLTGSPKLDQATEGTTLLGSCISILLLATQGVTSATF